MRRRAQRPCHAAQGEEAGGGPWWAWLASGYVQGTSALRDWTFCLRVHVWQASKSSRNISINRSYLLSCTICLGLPVATPRGNRTLQHRGAERLSAQTKWGSNRFIAENSLRGKATPRPPVQRVNQTRCITVSVFVPSDERPGAGASAAGGRSTQARASCQEEEPFPRPQARRQPPHQGQAFQSAVQAPGQGFGQCQGEGHRGPDRWVPRRSAGSRQREGAANQLCRRIAGSSDRQSLPDSAGCSPLQPPSHRAERSAGCSDREPCRGGRALQSSGSQS